MSLSTGGLGTGSTAVFVIHKAMNLVRFCEVYPSCDFPLWLLDIDEACGAEVGYDKPTGLNLGRNDSPLCLFLGYRVSSRLSGRYPQYSTLGTHVNYAPK